MPLPPSESAFWSELAETASHGWSVEVHSDAAGRPIVAGVDVFVYAYDTGTQWCASVGLRSADATAAIEQMSAHVVGW